MVSFMRETDLVQEWADWLNVLKPHPFLTLSFW